MKKRTKNLFQVCCYLSQTDVVMLNHLRELMPQLTNQYIFRQGIFEILFSLVNSSVFKNNVNKEI